MKTKTNLFKVFIIAGIGFCLLMALPAWSETFYVDVVNGSDENNGLSSSTAWGTLHFAVLQLNGLDTAEHVLNVSPGTYSVGNNENPEVNEPLTLTRSGVTIQGAAGVIIDGNNECGGWWDGFTVNAADVVLRDLEIKQFACEGNAGIYVYDGANARIESCDLNNNDYGVVFSSGLDTDHVVESCKIHSNGTGVDILGLSPQILRNMIYDNSTGINIREFSGQTIQPKIVNNLIYDSGSGRMQQGIYASAFSTGSTIAAVIHHNTIVGGLEAGMETNQESPNTSETLDIRFNIIANGNVGIQESAITSSILSADYNDVFNHATSNYNGVSPGIHDVSIDPQFRDGTNFDYHLASTSPLVNLIRADAGDTVTNDLDGVTRPKGLGAEMGCYEISDTSVIWAHDVGSTGYTRDVLPDINGDGYDELLLHLDPVLEQESTTLRVISGADGVTELWSYSLPLGRRGMAIIDSLDGDAIKDIIVITGTSGNGYGENRADDQMIALSGAVTPPVNREVWPEPLVVGYGLTAPFVLTDINGDGYADIFANTITPDSPYSEGDNIFHISGKDGTVLWNVDSYIWDIYGRTAAPGMSGGIFCGAITPTSGGVEVWQGGAEAVLAWRALASENIINPAVVGDLNSDGVAEIGVGKFHVTCPATPDPRLYILSGADGDVLWDYGLERTPSSIGSLGDVTGDGIDDIVIGTALVNSCGGSDSSVYAFDGNPAAVVRVLWTYPLAGQNSYVKVIPDTNGDGKKDVIVTGQIDKVLLLSGANGSPLNMALFPDTTVGTDVGEFNHTTGDDFLINYGYHIYALSFQTTEEPENNPPETPMAVYPLDEDIFDPEETPPPLQLKTSAFSDPDGDGHAKSYWEVERFDSQELLPSYMDFPSEIGLISHPVQDPLAPGLKYAWRVKYEDEKGAASGWSSKSTFKVGKSERESLPQVSAGKTRVDFGMISIVHWPDDPSPEKVFNIKYDPRYYRIGTYDPKKGGYIEFGEGLEIEPGRSYWMLAREGLAVNFNGIPVSKFHDIEVCLHHGADGWNMIAPPNDANYAWGEVLVGVWNEETEEFIPPAPLSTLTDDTIIDRRVWEWQSGAYISHLPEDDFLLERYKGYWVKAKVDGVYLVFSIPAQTGQVQSSRVVASSRARGTTAEDGDSPPMPMGALDENETDNILGGCFIETLKK